MHDAIIARRNILCVQNGYILCYIRTTKPTLSLFLQLHVHVCVLKWKNSFAVCSFHHFFCNCNNSEDLFFLLVFFIALPLVCNAWRLSAQFRQFIKHFLCQSNAHDCESFRINWLRCYLLSVLCGDTKMLCKRQKRSKICIQFNFLWSSISIFAYLVLERSTCSYTVSYAMSLLWALYYKNSSSFFYFVVIFLWCHNDCIIFAFMPHKLRFIIFEVHFQPYRVFVCSSTTTCDHASKCFEMKFSVREINNTERENHSDLMLLCMWCALFMDLV